MKKKKKVKKKKTGKKRNKGRRVLINVLLVLIIGMLIVSVYNIGKIFHNYRADKEAYNEVQENAIDEKLNVDWNELKATNADVVGWLYHEDCEINYPVVQGEDNNKYLHTLFNGSYGQAGTLFVDCDISNPFNQFSTVIYGHHMKDGTMFNYLKRFKEPEYTEKHGTFELLTPEKNYHLEVAAFLNCPSNSNIYKAEFYEDERAEYLKTIRSLSKYTTDVQLTEEDKLVVLSTCAYEYDNARYVVVGKLVPWE